MRKSKPNRPIKWLEYMAELVDDNPMFWLMGGLFLFQLRIEELMWYNLCVLIVAVTMLGVGAHQIVEGYYRGRKEARS